MRVVCMSRTHACVTNSYTCHELIHVSRTLVCIYQFMDGWWEKQMVIKVYEGCLHVTNSYICHELTCVSRTLVCMYQSVDGGWEKQMVVKVYESIIRSDLSLKQTVRVTNSCHACHELISYICHELMLHVSQSHKVYESNRLQWSLAQTNDGMCHELMSYVSRTCVSRAHVIYMSRTHFVCFANS